MKIAIVHDWLNQRGGGEKVLEAIYGLYPAPIFTLVHDPDSTRGTALENADIRTSFIQKLPTGKRGHRKFLPFFPKAVESFDFRGYDLVLSSSAAVSKNIIVPPDTLHICYVHSPIRYAWDLEKQYLEESGLSKGLPGMMARSMLSKIRAWDALCGPRADVLIANSKFISRRIQKCYRRESAVIHPPVDVDVFELETQKEDYYFTASRMVPYKKIDLIVEAFSRMPDRKLVVIGSGPDEKKIRALAGPNVELMGFQPTSVLREKMQKARAFVFAAEEDFGIVPVEAQACGTPVIVFGRGGALETVKENETGVYFNEQTPESLMQAVRDFETKSFDPLRVRKHAETFSRARFEKEYQALVERSVAEFFTFGRKP